MKTLLITLAILSLITCSIVLWRNRRRINAAYERRRRRCAMAAAARDYLLRGDLEEARECRAVYRELEARD